MVHPHHQSGSSQNELDDALTKTKEVAEEIKDAADELKVVHAVLETGVPSKQFDGDVQKAVGRTQDLEQQLQDSAEKLDAANELLERAKSQS